MQYIDGATTVVESHSTKPIIYFNKSHHLIEFSYLTKKKESLYSFLQPIDCIFHLEEMGNRLFLIDQAEPQNLIFFDTNTRIQLNSVCIDEKERLSNVKVLFNSESNLLFIVGNCNKTDLFVDVFLIKNNNMTRVTSKVFLNQIRLTDCHIVKQKGSLTRFVVSNSSKLMLLNFNSKNLYFEVHKNFSTDKTIRKTSSNKLLQLFATLDTSGTVKFFDDNGLQYLRFKDDSAMIVDFIFMDNSILTFDNKGCVKGSNLTANCLQLRHKIEQHILSGQDTMLFHRNKSHLFTVNKNNMMSIYDYSANKELARLMINKSNWSQIVQHNTNLYLFSETNLYAYLKYKDEQFLTEYYLFENFADKISCIANTASKILFGSVEGKVFVFDPLKQKIEDSNSLSAYPIKTIATAELDDNEFVVKHDNVIEFGELTPVLRCLSFIDETDSQCDKTILIKNRELSNYNITSYFLFYCSTDTELRVKEINRTSEFVDVNLLFEFDFDEKIVDFEFNEKANQVILLLETKVLTVNKTTGFMETLAGLNYNGLKLVFNPATDSFAVIQYDQTNNRSFVEVFDFNNGNLLATVENYNKIVDLKFIRDSIIVISDKGLIEVVKLTKLSTTLDEFYSRSMKVNQDSPRVQPVPQMKEKKSTFFKSIKSKYIKNTINESKSENILSALLNKYTRKPFTNAEYKTNALAQKNQVNKKFGTEAVKLCDYKENLDSLMSSLRRFKMEKTIESNEILEDPADIDDC